MHASRWPILCVLALLLAVNLVVYTQVLGQGFERYDTAAYVTDNAMVRDGVSGEGLVWAFDPRHGYAANWHPLTWLSHMLDCQLFGLDRPGMHKATSAVLHILNSWLLFWALWRLTGPLRATAPLPRAGSRPDSANQPDVKQPAARQRASQPPEPKATSDTLDLGRLCKCAFVALMFAVHPLHVESVAWVAERKDVLSGLFWMLTLIAYAYYASAPNWRRMSLVAFCLALGLMAKPMLVTLPCVLLLLDVWPLARGPVVRLVGWVHTWRMLFLEKLPLFALVALSSVMTYLVQQQGGAVNLAPGPAQRIAGAIWAYWMYLAQTFWPTRLACFYPRDTTSENPFSLPVLAAAAALVIVTMFVVAQRIRRPYLMVGWFWYLGTLVPVNGLFVQVGEQAHADRYTYLPLIGIFIMLAWGVPDLLVRWRGSRLARPMSAILLGAMAVLTVLLMALSFQQAKAWESSEALFRHAVQVTPNNAFARASLGAEYRRAGKYPEALRECETAVALDPDDWNNQVNLALVLMQMDRTEEARRHAQAAVRLMPGEARTHAAMARLLALQKQYAESIASFEKSVALDPTIQPVRVYFAQSLMALGRIREAGQQLETAIELNPRDPKARMLAAVVCATEKEWRQAEEHLQAILSVDPEHEDANLLQAQFQMQRDESGPAIASYRRIVARIPDQPDAANNLAWLLSMKGSGPADRAEAIVVAERICRATKRQNPALLDTLALAYAVSGRFDEAVQTLDEAIALAKAQQQSAMLEQLEQSRAAYRAGKLAPTP